MTITLQQPIAAELERRKGKSPWPSKSVQIERALLARGYETAPPPAPTGDGATPITTEGDTDAQEE